MNSGKNAKQEIVISTYKGGLPRFRVLITVSYCCFLPIAIFVFGVVVILTAPAKPPGWEYLVCFFFLCIGIITAFAILNLIPETVRINDHGINIHKRWKNKETTWHEITEVRGKRVLKWLGRGIIDIAISTTPAVVIKTRGWKHTLCNWKYGGEELQSVFLFITERVTPIGAVIEDELGWLPETLYPREKVYLGRMREYMTLSKVGGFMILIGVVLFAMGAFGEIYSIGGFILLFIGGMCALCGGLGYFYEK